MRNFYNPESIVTIDVLDINTGEVYETLKDLWGGDVKKAIAKVSESYKVVNVERYRSDWISVWVEVQEA